MFRWKRGLLHALIPFAFVIAAGLVVLFATDPGDPEKAGESVGRFAAIAFVIGIVISWLAQTGKKLAALLAALGLFLFTAAMVVGGITASKRGHGSELRSIDRLPLVDTVVAGKHRLKHSTYGFSVLRPPPSYQESPQLAAQLGGFTNDPGSVYYVYAENPPAGVFYVGLLADIGATRVDFSDAIRGIRHGLETAASGSGMTAQVVKDEITGTDGHLEAHFHAVVEGVHMQVNAYQVHPAGKPPSAVTVAMVSPDPALLADVLASFQP